MRRTTRRLVAGDWGDGRHRPSPRRGSPCIPPHRLGVDSLKLRETPTICGLFLPTTLALNCASGVINPHRDPTGPRSRGPRPTSDAKLADREAVSGPAGAGYKQEG